MNSSHPLLILNRDADAPIAHERELLDLRHYHFSHRIRDLRVIGTWLRDKSQEECLVIVEASRPIEQCNPCVVRLSEMHKWSEEMGDQVYTALMAVEFCSHLANKNPGSTDDIFQVINTIRLRWTDLKNMPPAPLMPQRLAGHLTVHTEDEKTYQHEVYENE